MIKSDKLRCILQQNINIFSTKSNSFVFPNVCACPCLWGVKLMTEENNLTIEHRLYIGFVRQGMLSWKTYGSVFKFLKKWHFKSFGFIFIWLISL